MSFRVSVWMTLSKVMLLAGILVFPHVGSASALLSDDFNTATSEPNPSWRFHDPYAGNAAAESQQTFDGTNALISIPAGLSHDLWKTAEGNKAPRLLQPAPNNDFKFEVKFETAPKVKHQLQGIIVQQSDNVFLRFDVYYGTSGTSLFIAYVDGTTGSVTTHKSAALPISPNYRQVIRSGDNWTFRYSNDGTTWTDVTFTQSLVVSEVGFFAGTQGLNPKFLSSVDYFNDLDEPIVDNDTWTPPTSENVPPPVISTWYKYGQTTSGSLGVSQKWANILGNVSTEGYISRLEYTINGSSEPIALNYGPDFRRLQESGDFNIEIDNSLLNVGFNQIEIRVRDSEDQVSTKLVTFNYVPESHWPLPYTADWGSIANIQEVENIAHIVDGSWKLTADGIRTDQIGYDRSIAIGDKAWPSDYEVTVPITFHAGFSGVGFAVGWQGHEGGQSPKIEWPLQALAWIRGPINNPTLEIITYGGLPSNTWEDVRTPDPQHPLSLTQNVTYMLKSSSVSLGNGNSRFSVKLWRKGEAEPVAWDVNADVKTRDGSVLLLAYKGDVTFGNVVVEGESVPINVPEPEDTPIPKISNVQVTTTENAATITWNTDRATNSTLDFGLNNQYGMNENNSAQTTTHSISLADLNPNTAYHFQAKSADSENKTGSSGDMVFTTKASTSTEPPIVETPISSPVPAPPAAPPPVVETPIDSTPLAIKDVQISAAETTATVTWKTDVASNSLINYGTNSTYGLNVIDSAQTTSHSLTLTGLNPGAEYHYQIKSTDSQNNMISSEDLVLATKASEDPLAPVISNIQSKVTGSSVVVTWDTDKPATSEINFGLGSDYGENVKDTVQTKKHSLNVTLKNSNVDIDYFYQIRSADMNNKVASIEGVYKLIGNKKGMSKKAKECLFYWAERQYPELFSPALARSQDIENYTYRYYSKTKIYLGFHQDKNVHMLDENKDEGIVDVGDVRPYQKMAGCL